jgi:hypothetical protein
MKVLFHLNSAQRRSKYRNNGYVFDQLEGTCDDAVTKLLLLTSPTGTKFGNIAPTKNDGIELISLEYKVYALNCFKVNVND